MMPSNIGQRTPCSQCGGEVTYRTIAEQFEREGMRVELSGIRALVCTQCGETYFEPGGAQALVESADSLFALARRNRQHSGEVATVIPAMASGGGGAAGASRDGRAT